MRARGLPSSTFFGRGKGDLFRRTETPQFYPLDPSATGALSASSPSRLHVSVIDFLGTTDEREHIAKMTSKLAHASTYFVVILNASHVAGPERLVVNMARQFSPCGDFMILINKIDRVQDEIRSKGIEQVCW